MGLSPAEVSSQDKGSCDWEMSGLRVQLSVEADERNKGGLSRAKREVPAAVEAGRAQSVPEQDFRGDNGSSFVENLNPFPLRCCTLSTTHLSTHGHSPLQQEGRLG